MHLNSKQYIGNNKPAQTKIDRSLLAINNLYATAAILEDTNTILQLCGALLTDEGASTNQKKQMANNIKCLVVPFNTGAVALLWNTAKSMVPMAGCKRFHKTVKSNGSKTQRGRYSNAARRQGR